MTDLEMTKKCAEAIGYRVDADGGFSRLQQGAGMDEPDWFEFIYDPLRDDAQAMALAKKFLLDVDFFSGGVQLGYEAPDQFRCWSDKSINYAIVECVAKMETK